jgi:hypothetical protein
VLLIRTPSAKRRFLPSVFSVSANIFLNEEAAFSIAAPTFDDRSVSALDSVGDENERSRNQTQRRVGLTRRTVFFSDNALLMLPPSSSIWPHLFENPKLPGFKMEIIQLYMMASHKFFAPVHETSAEAVPGPPLTRPPRFGICAGP